MKIKYQCDYCLRYFYSKKECLDHEKGCDDNPKIKSCRTCGHSDENLGQTGVHYYSCAQGHKETNRSWKRNCDHWNEN